MEYQLEMEDFPTMMKKEHIEMIQKAAAAVKAKETVNHFYFVACGGSKALFHPAEYIMDRETAIPTTVYTANEFIHRCPKALGKDSVVITCSHSGNTPETVEATRFAREKGALTISFSHLPGSPLWETTEYPIHYDWFEEGDPSNYNTAMVHSLVFHILNALQPCKMYEDAIAAIELLPDLFDKNIAKYMPAAKEFGRNYRREEIIYTMASGANYGLAYSFAICLLMEMMWVNSNSIHSGEYFHGPFEITDYDVPFLVIKGIDECRPLDERALTFCEKFSDRITVIDAADFDMTGISEELKGYFAPLIANIVLRKYAEQLADQKGHPLTVRRYMWRMDY